MDKDSLTLGVLGEWPARSHPARGNGARLPPKDEHRKIRRTSRPVWASHSLSAFVSCLRHYDAD